PDREAILTVLREKDGEETPGRVEIKVSIGRRGLIGVVLAAREIEERVPFPASLIRAAAETEREIRLWFWSMAGLIRGDLSHKELTGPIGIYQETEKFAERGLVELLRFIASISIIIGLVNLLPIPVLDGGNILIIAVEGIIRRPLGERTMAAVQYAGLGLIAMIFLLVFYNDIVYRILGLE
ncbi:MAG TPA: site-2 protease family protein, partial [bacterium]|nr:site-2 protease family protein [bacterium]